MTDVRLSVEQHYGVDGILQAILKALEAMGKDIEQLSPADLAPVDEFHIRGREATVELANRANLSPGRRVLDVGCGLGGSVRYLATEHKCQATGIDLVAEYIEIATALAERVGLSNVVEFRQANALALPFDAGSLDVAWTEHAQMNISDKAGFYGEIARVLKPGGRLVFHDIFAGDGGEPHFPVPWAEKSTISFLEKPASLRAILDKAGLKTSEWEEKSQHSLEWFEAVIEKTKESGPPPLGLHLLMRETAQSKFENVIRNLRENRIVVVQVVAEKA
ncbi:MAG: methyltransferase domain-containing protein [Gammaproteobacteria bacterium]|nr:methyltransferase domain-containing protein [Gammaproteobacteria bacterium]